MSDDETEELRGLLAWALQVIDDDVGYEVKERNGPMYRRARAIVDALPDGDLDA